MSISKRPPYVPTAGILAMLERLKGLTSNNSFGESLDASDYELRIVDTKIAQVQKNMDALLYEKQGILKMQKMRRKLVAEVITDLVRIGVPDEEIRACYIYNGHDIAEWIKAE